MKYKWILQPVIDPLYPVTAYEHTPADYYRSGEYPRFLRPVGAHRPRREWVKLYEDGSIAKPGELPPNTRNQRPA